MAKSEAKAERHLSPDTVYTYYENVKLVHFCSFTVQLSATAGD